LAVGVILASLGWYYGQPLYTGAGLIPLIALYALAALFPAAIDYTHSGHEEPIPAVVSWVWRGAAYVGVGLFLAAMWHSSVSGGTGVPLALAAAALPASIVGYGMINDERVRHWRAARGLRRRRRPGVAA
jgi:hypothetical protein